MKQISVICKNADDMTRITELLSGKGIDIRDLNFQQLAGDAVLNLVVNDFDQCLALLAGDGYSAITDDTLLLKVADQPGMLAKISRDVTGLGVDIRSLTIMDIGEGDSVIAVSTSDNAKVREAYASQLIN